AVRTAEFMRFVGIKRGVNAAKHHESTGGPRAYPALVSTQRVPRVNADADDIARLDFTGVELFECFVDKARVAVPSRCCAGQDIQPARCNDANSERNVTGVNEIDGHATGACRTSEVNSSHTNTNVPPAEAI